MAYEATILAYIGFVVDLVDKPEHSLTLSCFSVMSLSCFLPGRESDVEAVLVAYQLNEQVRHVSSLCRVALTVSAGHSYCVVLTPPLPL